MNAAVRAERPVADPSAQSPVTTGNRASDLIDRASTPQGVNTQQLGQWVAEAQRKNPQEGSATYAEVEQQLLEQHGAGTMGRFQQDVQRASQPSDAPQNEPAIGSATDPAIAGTAGARAGRDSAPQRFPTADSAAEAALNRANPHSVRDNLEYGGKVFQDPKTGTYSASRPRAGTDTGFDPYAVSEPKGRTTVGDYHTHGDYSVQGPNGEAVRTSDPNRDAYRSDRFSDRDHHGITQDAKGRPGYTGYLGTPSGEFRRFEPGSTNPNNDTVFARQGSDTAGGHARSGAATGAVVDAGFGTVRALADGKITGAEAGQIAQDGARGAAVGAAYAVTERSAVRVADRLGGLAAERGATQLASVAGAADAGAAGALARTAATRLSGAGVAGAVVSAGVSIVENREGLMRGDSSAIGNVAGSTVVGAGAAVAGMAAGAAIGSVVPVAGTAIGAVVGLAVGFGADYVMRAGGVDQVVSNAVTGAVDAGKNAAKTVAGWLGF